MGARDDNYKLEVLKRYFTIEDPEPEEELKRDIGSQREESEKLTVEDKNE